MDYVLEALARQERLWRRLLLDPPEKEREPSQGQSGRENGAELAGAAPVPMAGAAEAAALAAALDRESGRRQNRERREAQVREAGPRRTNGPEAPGEARAEAGRAAEETDESGLPWSLERQDGEHGTADARVVSLALERDARRYDGGYVLY